jgi:hypothetical protein
MKTMKTTQGILKATKVVFNFRNIGFKGLPTLGVGSMQSFFYLVVGASQSLMFYFNGLFLALFLMFPNVLVPTHYCEKGFPLVHIYNKCQQFLGKEYGTNYNVKLVNILNAHCTPHCLNRINSIIGL